MILLQIEIDEKFYDLEIGQNKYENDTLLKKSNQNDLWFHLENDSSPFIILHNNGDKIHKSHLNKIASMFRDYKTNIGFKFQVIYTNVKNIQKTNTPGTVILKCKPNVIKI